MHGSVIRLVSGDAGESPARVCWLPHRPTPAGFRSAWRCQQLATLKVSRTRDLLGAVVTSRSAVCLFVCSERQMTPEMVRNPAATHLASYPVENITLLKYYLSIC